MEENKVLVLDGAAGTYLESLGTPMHPLLWGSGALLTPEGQEDIRKLHRAYFKAGADVSTSLTYQTSITGFQRAGLSQQEAFDTITKAVVIAREVAREAGPTKLVAGGLGPYGSYLAEGQEYTGDYGKASIEELRQFWIPRVQAILAGDPDVLLFETIPNRTELELLVNEAVPLARNAGIPVWISLSVRTNEEAIKLADGTCIAELQPLFDGSESIKAIGANCFDVRAVPKVIEAFSILRAPLIIYPNSGEIYDGTSHTWSKPESLDTINSGWDPAAWAKKHVRVIGGCCRTTPNDIACVAQALH